jgi:hypothetical protein
VLRSEVFEMRTSLGTEGKRNRGQGENGGGDMMGGRKGKRKMIDSTDIYSISGP